MDGRRSKLILVLAGIAVALACVGLLAHAHELSVDSAAARAAGIGGVSSDVLRSLGRWDALASLCWMAMLFLLSPLFLVLATTSRPSRLDR